MQKGESCRYADCPRAHSGSHSKLSELRPTLRLLTASLISQILSKVEAGLSRTSGPGRGGY